MDAIKLADKGKGVLYIVLNHAGDMLTGNMTMKKCAKEGLNVIKVVTQEDIANAPRSNADDRRGLVGMHSPPIRSQGSGCGGQEPGGGCRRRAALCGQYGDPGGGRERATHPATGSLLADLGEDEMEIGMGQHGEGGGGRQSMKSAGNSQDHAGRPAGGSGHQGRRRSC